MIPFPGGEKPVYKVHYSQRELWWRQASVTQEHLTLLQKYVKHLETVTFCSEEKTLRLRCCMQAMLDIQKVMNCSTADMLA